MEYLIYKDNAILNYMHLKRHRKAFDIINNDIKNNKQLSVILDLGCGEGHMSRYLLSEGFSVLGLDISKEMLTKARSLCNGIGQDSKNFLCANMFDLPIKKNSVDVVIMMSVIEHTLDLENTLKNIKSILKTGGTLIIGYPIETKLFKFLVKYLWSDVYWTIDPTVIGAEEYYESPNTHKQNYMVIRKVLNNHFKIIQRSKLFFDLLPDFLSYYEVVKLSKKEYNESDS